MLSKVKVELDEQLIADLRRKVKLIPGYTFDQALADLVRRAIEEYGQEVNDVDLRHA